MQIKTSLFKGSVLGISDQALLSLTNFAIGFILIRFGSKVEFGEYSLAFAIILFFTSIYNALVNLPITITAVKLEDKRRRCFVGSQCIGLYLVLIPSVLFLFGLLQVAPKSMLPVNNSTASVVVLAIVGILSRELVRTLNFAKSKIAQVLYIDLVYVIILMSSIGFFFYVQRLTTVSVVASIGWSSLIAGVVFFWSVKDSLHIKWVEIRKDLIKSWQDSRWILGGVLQSWVVNHGFLFVLAYLLTQEEVAQVNATRLPLAPLGMMFLAWGKVFTPQGARFVAQNQLDYARRLVLKYTAAFTGLVIVYVVLLTQMTNLINEFMFKDKYNDVLFYLVLWGCVYLAINIRTNAMHLLGVLSKFKDLYFLGLVNAFLNIIISFFMIRKFGAPGALITLIFSEFLLALMLWVAFYRVHKVHMSLKGAHEAI